MQVHIIGENTKVQELVSTFPETIQHTVIPLHQIDMHDFSGVKVLFDLSLDDNPENLLFYAHCKDLVVIGSAVKVSLSDMVHRLPEPISCSLFGINALHGFLSRPLKEMTAFNEERISVLEEVVNALGWQYRLVSDRVGMVTPRVICMIINEAFYTNQEGTASVIDIDESMRLGVNYPKGPFEWCDEIGIKDVYEVLSAIYDDTKDERYKICSLLKTSYLRG